MRKTILEAAARLFQEEGYQQVTIRRIAAAIEYSPRTIYLYFQDKAEIVQALQAEGYQRLLEKQQAVPVDQGPLERLVGQGCAYVAFALDNPELFRLMVGVPGMTPRPEEEGQSTGRRSFQFLVDNVNECMTAGELPPANPKMAALAIWSMVHGAATIFAARLAAGQPMPTGAAEPMVRYMLQAARRNA